MMKNEVLTVKDAVHKLQLYLLEGIKNENQLAAAGSLMSRSDYRDVVTERTIANMCGYPLCSNSLPPEQLSNGHYRISLKLKIYDHQETYIYCSTNCLKCSRAFSASLREERCSSLSRAYYNEVLKLYDGLSLESSVNTGKKGDLGLSDLKIHEKADTTAGEVSLEEWIGPSNAIDGYVPRKDQNLESRKAKILKEDVRQKQVEFEDRHDPVANILANDMNFTSVIITQDGYKISKTVSPAKADESKGKGSSKGVNRQGKTVQKLPDHLAKVPEAKPKRLNKLDYLATTDAAHGVLEDIACPSKNDDTKEENQLQLGKQSAAGPSALKSSLKTSVSKKETRSVTWADEMTVGDRQNVRKLNGITGVPTSLPLDKEVSEESYRFASAEACARALSEAAEAVALGKADVSDAVSEAGLIILPLPNPVDEPKSEKNGDIVDTNPLEWKWPPKPGSSDACPLGSEDSWSDSPPDGFSLTLSPFSTMFMAVFGWISTSSLAYIYGKEESFHEEYLFVNGQEYPRKIVISDGLSSEIKQTLAGCLSRALPGLVSELRLPIPISTLEQGMARLIDTMSFINPLPAFRMKQWQVIALLFLDSLSIRRIPSLTPYLVDTRILLPKVLEGAQISTEELEVLKNVIIPLGRLPEFSTQSGG